MEYSDKDEYAVCNLASIAVNKFYNEVDNSYDYNKLYQVAYCADPILTRWISNYYPTPSKKSNLKNRPIGLGIQGLADVFALMRYPYESQEANDLNKHYGNYLFASLTASKDLAKSYGPYEKFKGSPFSEGKLQFHLWDETPQFDKWNWSELIDEIKKYGTRNSLLTSLMPTASQVKYWVTTNVLSHLHQYLF